MFSTPEKPLKSTFEDAPDHGVWLSVSRKLHDFKSRSRWKRSRSCITASNSACRLASRRRWEASIHLLRCRKRKTLRAFRDKRRSQKREHCGQSTPPREALKPFSSGRNSLAHWAQFCKAGL